MKKETKIKDSRPSWEEYFMGIAEKISERSKDPSTKTGCIFVDEKNRPVSFGYNGFIGGCNEKKMTWERPMKYYLVIHAEMNAILFAKKDLSNCTVYSLYAPCENCLKHMIQAGIKNIIYKNPVVESKVNNNTQSMTTQLTNEAITRMLLSMPEVNCRNISGKSYLKEMWGNNIPKF